MNTLVIVLIAAVCLIAGYTFYGSWLAKKWGIDPKAKTPAVAKNDGQDYVPTDGWTVFAHQFSSIAGAGPVTGAIQAAVFGWVPVLLWILIGGIFFGAVTDFGALYASVKNEGKSMGLLIEKYIGKTGKKLFLLFCWLFTLIVIAAFADMVAGTFNAYETVDGVTKLSAQATVNGAAGSISLLFIAFAVVFGLLQKKLQWKGWKEMVLGLACTVAAFAIGMNVPLVTSKATWTYLVFAYIFLAAVLPMWLLMQPRDFMTTFMFAGMILGAVVGLVVAHPIFQCTPVSTMRHPEICSRSCLSPLPVVLFPDSTAWYRLEPLRKPLRMKKICRKSDTELWFWRACLPSSPSALPVLLLLQTVRLLSERHLRSFLPVLPDFWKCSASRYTEHSAS